LSISIITKYRKYQIKKIITKQH